MARTVQIHLLDDLDGSPADETVRFSLDTTSYVIDLSTAHSDQLRKALAKYIVAGRRASRGATAVVASKQSSGVSTQARNRAIREWAKRSGRDINDRGRIPASVVEIYEKDIAAN